MSLIKGTTTTGLGSLTSGNVLNNSYTGSKTTASGSTKGITVNGGSGTSVAKTDLTPTKTTYTGGSSAADELAEYKKNLLNQYYQSALESLQASLNSTLNQINSNYEDLEDESEIQRYKSLNRLGDVLKDNGQYGSGYGRQTMLNNETNYANQLIGLKKQREQDIEDAKKAYNTDKASIDSSFATNLMNL